MADQTSNTPNLTPASSPELSRLFKLEQSVEEAHRNAPAPGNLPSYEEDADIPIEVMEQQQMEQSSTTRPQLVTGDEAVAEAHKHPRHAAGEPKADNSVETAPAQPKPTTVRTGNIIKRVAPYLAVFIIGLLLYNFYFNDVSFSSLFKGEGNTAAVKKVDSAALAALQKSETDSYNSWISQFFFDVSDPEIVGMNTDVSGNGLTNFQKYLLNLNPKIYDTLGDNAGDGQKIIDNKNPWTGSDLTESQRKIADTYFDKELISNRIAAAQAKHDNAAFAPYVSNHSPYYQAGVSNIVNGDAAVAQNSQGSNGAVAGATVYTPSAQASNGIRGNASINTSGNTSGNTTTNSTPSGPSPSPTRELSSLGINTAIPGSINIPSINTTVPLVWSQDPKNFEADLKNGVIHYPGTPLPGEMGTSYISGHSSGYFWDKSQYKLAFARLGSVKNGDSFTITVMLKNGKQAILHYRVDGRAEYAADDPRQFLQSSDSVVALSTCWPLSTTARRLVLYGVLTQVEK